MLREDGRKFNEERKIKITKDVNIYAEGSVLIEVGNTKVICTASVSEKVPPFLRGTGKGWVTAEYSMLPRATNERNQREASKGKLTGRTVEIQRLIGRALRSAIDLEKLGERLITIDCDVIQADGGTRTTSITGGYVALALAIKKLLNDEILEENPLIANVAAISVGKIDSELMVDLKYSEDSAAEVDMNVIMNKKGEFIEVQGTGEESTFTRTELNGLLDLAEASIKRIIDLQDKVIEQENLKIFLATGNKHKIEEISDILYAESNAKTVSYIKSLQTEDELFVLLDNFNWDNGFEVPQAVINHSKCTLSIALLAFYRADGIRYLLDAEAAFANSLSKVWEDFVKDVYDRIIRRKFPDGNISFRPEITRIQKFKLKKLKPALNPIFIDEVSGKDLNIVI